MILTRVKQATNEFIKVLRFGKSDVQTADQILPYGVDSKPVKNDLAVYSKTNNKNQAIILGYLKTFENTNEGETRIYATDSNGNEVFDILLKNDGTCEIGGNIDFLTRFNGLNTDLQSYLTELNSKLVTAFTAVGGSWPGITLDISNAKIEEIKTL